ncbi:glycerol-3-phosphate dehydrogenase/oxidase [Bacillaceae bacterium S4-13-58]
MTFSSKEREQMLTEIESDQLDVLVIGGGITGAGIALDAVTRGLKVAVVEMQDFAAGTSSRSTKLVHGGLRYLKQFEIGVVAEVGKERAVVYENGPHVTTPEWMMLPFYKGGTFGPFTTNIGLRVYDFLAGVKKSERRKMLSAEEAKRREPLLNEENLRGAGYYVEYRTDDARLTIEVMKKAIEKGARAINYVKVTNLIYNELGQITGVEIADQTNGNSRNLYAKKIVNAAGPWVDTIREKDKSKVGKTLLLTKGIHLVFDQKRFPLRQAIYFDTPDGRMVFAIPRDGKAYVGTTDTVYEEGDIVHPTMTKEDAEYVLNAIDYMFPSIKIKEEDIESSWAGLRPLIREEGKGPSEISRKDEIFISDSGLISIAGGKLTGYRKMAEQVVDKVAALLQQETGTTYPSTQTEHLPISGGDVGGSKAFTNFISEKTHQGEALGLSKDAASLLVQRYGSNVNHLFEIYAERKQEAIDNGIDPVAFAMLIYSIEHEMAYKPVDFFVRRTGALFFDIEWVKTNKDPIIEYMAKYFSWTNEQTNQYTNELEQLLTEAVNPETKDEMLV